MVESAKNEHFHNTRFLMIEYHLLDTISFSCQARLLEESAQDQLFISHKNDIKVTYNDIMSAGGGMVYILGNPIASEICTICSTHTSLLKFHFHKNF